MARCFSSSSVRPEPALDDAVEALHRAGGDDALRGAADAEQQVDAGALAGGHDRAGHVAVGDELDPGAGGADLVDQLLVARPVEHDDGDVLGLGCPWPWRPGGCSRRRGSGCRRRRRPPARSPASPCRTPPTGRTSSPAGRPRARRSRWPCPWRRAWCRRWGRRRRRTAGPSPSPTSSPLNSIGALSFSPSPMTTVPRMPDGRDQHAHRVDGDAVGAVLVALADPATGGHRGRLGDADQLERQVAVGDRRGRRTRESGTWLSDMAVIVASTPVGRMASMSESRRTRGARGRSLPAHLGRARRRDDRDRPRGGRVRRASGR